MKFARYSAEPEQIYPCTNNQAQQNSVHLFHPRAVKKRTAGVITGKNAQDFGALTHWNVKGDQEQGSFVELSLLGDTFLLCGGVFLLAREMHSWSWSSSREAATLGSSQGWEIHPLQDLLV